MQRKALALLKATLKGYPTKSLMGLYELLPGSRLRQSTPSQPIGPRQKNRNGTTLAFHYELPSFLLVLFCVPGFA
jgi:hypothetical protein